MNNINNTYMYIFKSQRKILKYNFLKNFSVTIKDDHLYSDIYRMPEIY